jgi:hypothetical protein
MAKHVRLKITTLTILRAWPSGVTHIGSAMRLSHHHYHNSLFPNRLCPHWIWIPHPLCLFFILFYFFPTGSCYVPQTGLSLTILLPQPPQFWDYWCVLTCLSAMFIFNRKHSWFKACKVQRLLNGNSLSGFLVTELPPSPVSCLC